MSTLEARCRGEGFNSNQFNQWNQLWQTGACTTEFNDILYTQSTGERGYNAQALPRIQNDMQAVFSKYLNFYGFQITSNINSANFNDLQVLLHNTCQQLPGGCDLFLSQYCSALSRQQIATDPAALAFCGCLSQVNSLSNENQACDPLCTKQRVIKFPDGTGGFLECNQAVCVIDNFNLEATQASVGSVSINQVCNVCPPDGCKCIVDVSDLQEIEEQIGMTTVNQFCGADSECFQFNQGQPVVPVTCSALPPPTPGFDSSISLGTWIIIAVILITVLVVFVAVLIYYFTRDKGKLK